MWCPSVPKISACTVHPKVTIPHAHSFRAISHLRASRLPFKHAFTFTSAHTPESLHKCARTSRNAHLASSSLHYAQTGMFPAPSAPPSMPPRTMFGARVRSRQPAEQNKLSRSGYGEQDRRRPDSPCVNHTFLSQGWTAVERTPRTSARAGPPLSAARGGSGPITSLPRYRQDVTLRPFVGMSKANCARRNVPDERCR